MSSPRGRRHREEHDRGLLALELVDGPDRHVGQPARVELAAQAADLRVVGRHDHEVARPRARAVTPSAIGVAAADQAARSRPRSARPPRSTGACCLRGRAGSSRTPVPVSGPSQSTRWSAHSGDRRTAGPRRRPRRRTRQTSGCMRRVWSRKTPRSGGIVPASPSRCSSTEQPDAGRVRALRDLGELERVAEQDHVARRGRQREGVGERDLAGLVDHEVVDGARACPRGTTATRCRPSGRRPSAVGNAPRAVGRLDQRLVELRLEARSRRRSASAGRGSRRRARRRASRPRASRLWIALWLLAATPTRWPASSRRQDQLGAGVGLARAGRALDEQVAVARARAAIRVVVVEVGRRRPAAARRARRQPCSGRARRRIARARSIRPGAVEAVVEDAVGELAQRGLLQLVS